MLRLLLGMKALGVSVGLVYKDEVTSEAVGRHSFSFSGLEGSAPASLMTLCLRICFLCEILALMSSLRWSISFLKTRRSAPASSATTLSSVRALSHALFSSDDSAMHTRSFSSPSSSLNMMTKPLIAFLFSVLIITGFPAQSDAPMMSLIITFRTRGPSTPSMMVLAMAIVSLANPTTPPPTVAAAPTMFCRACSGRKALTICVLSTLWTPRIVLMPRSVAALIPCAIPTPVAKLLSARAETSTVSVMIRLRNCKEVPIAPSILMSRCTSDLSPSTKCPPVSSSSRYFATNFSTRSCRSRISEIRCCCVSEHRLQHLTGSL
mmetsp:Transcript_16973/g.56212  ORF Transcript_16973/g.56212 Transcript_16973/m.56212 type:complete len:321 (+) Transcript_16973:117-1079(+)